MKKVAIAGGGLAGLACAKRLVDAGFHVRLVEANPYFGGRATSWRDERLGETVESGVHTFFAMYDRLTRLLNEVGVDVDQMVTWHHRIGFMRPDHKLHTFGIDPVRDHLGTLLSVFSNNDYLDPLQKFKVARTILRGLMALPAQQRHSIKTLAQQAGVDRQTYDRLFEPLSRGLFFLEAHEASAHTLINLIKHMMLNPLSVRAGIFNGGMGEVMIEPIVKWLRAHGAQLDHTAPVDEIIHEGGRVAGLRLKSGERIEADHYVSALPIEILQRLIPASLEGVPYFSRIKQMGVVPATAVQLWFDRHFMKEDLLLFIPASPVPIFQDESHVSFPRHGSRISCEIVSRSTDGFSDQQYIDTALAELVKAVPASAQAKLEKAVVTRHYAFAARVGVEALRPSQRSPVANLSLCGDFTRQSWFTTMEGATRSGEAAARTIIRQ